MNAKEYFNKKTHNRYVSTRPEDVAKLMEEYAQLKAIEFQDWANENIWIKQEGEGGLWFQPSYDEPKFFTTRELYELFKEQNVSSWHSNLCHPTAPSSEFKCCDSCVYWDDVGCCQCLDSWMMLEYVHPTMSCIHHKKR